MQWFTGDWWQFGVLGMTGGALVDGIEVWKAVRLNGGEWPRRYRTLGYLAAELIRLLAGGALATVFGISDQIKGPIGAFAIGVTAPLIIEKMLNPDATFGSNDGTAVPKRRRNSGRGKHSIRRGHGQAKLKEGGQKSMPKENNPDLGVKGDENPTNQS